MASSFTQRAAEALQDDGLRSALTRSTGLLNRWRHASYAETADFASLQAAASALRRQAIADLPALLQQLEAAVRARGAEVIWAVDGVEACRIVVALAQARGAKTIVRSRSRIAEEIGLDAALQAAELRAAATELGDAILQLAGDRASHPVYPALHWRKEAVATLFTERLDMPETVDIQSMASMARFKLRRQLLKADMSVSSVDLAAADTGVLAFAGDSGADRFGLGVARCQVVLMGIDQVAGTLEDLFLLLQLKARSASGAALPSSVTLLDGPAQPADPDGPNELVLVIVDNGRSDLMRWGYGEALACISCGACANACPVYREIGGLAYGAEPAGPIGAVLAPLSLAPQQQGTPGKRRILRLRPRSGRTSSDAGDRAAVLATVLRDTAFADLPRASTLCGACAEVCPVGIDIPGLLVRLRGDLAQAGRQSQRARLGRQWYAWAMATPANYARMQRWLARGARLPGARRLQPASQTFRERWQARGEVER